MNINGINLFTNKNNYQNNNIKKGYYPNLAPLAKDTVSFGTMKKNQFEGLDLITVNKFKIPIEKFNINDDLQTWCYDKLSKNYINKLYIAKSPEMTEKHTNILDEWFQHCLKDNSPYTKATSLLMLDSITSPLTGNSNIVPPFYDENVVKSTLKEIDEKAKKNRNYNVDFNKLYQKNFNNYLLNNISSDVSENSDNTTGWVKIPSLKHDYKNFDQNVKKLQTLSAPSWCTKSTRTEKYLEKGDFHIYLEKGKPKVGVMFIGDTIVEIQGTSNNGKIPIKYLDIIKEYTENFDKSEKIIQELSDAENGKNNINDYINKLGKPIETASVEELLAAANLFEKRDDDGLIILKSFSQPDEHFTWSDIDVNDANLFKDVKEINGNADFRGSNINNLGNLKRIGGNAIIRGSRIENLGNLKEIKGNADFKDSIIKNLGNLEKIGGYVDFSDSKIEDLGNLKQIGLDAYFENSEITDLGNLEVIEGNADFNRSNVKTLGKLKRIGCNANFSYSDIEDISGLQEVGGRVKFQCSKINPLDIIQKGFSM